MYERRIAVDESTNERAIWKRAVQRGRVLTRSRAVMMEFAPDYQAKLNRQHVKDCLDLLMKAHATSAIALFIDTAIEERREAERLEEAANRH